MLMEMSRVCFFINFLSGNANDCALLGAGRGDGNAAVCGFYNRIAGGAGGSGNKRIFGNGGQVFFAGG